MATAIKTQITATAIYRVVVKETGKECYMVPSDSQSGVYYQSCWDEASSSWTCTCKHGTIMAQYGKGASCKHTRACQTSVLANKAARARAIADEQNMVELKVEMEQDEALRFNPWHGSNRDAERTAFNNMSLALGF